MQESVFQHLSYYIFFPSPSLPVSCALSPAYTVPAAAEPELSRNYSKDILSVLFTIIHLFPMPLFSTDGLWSPRQSNVFWGESFPLECTIMTGFFMWELGSSCSIGSYEISGYQSHECLKILKETNAAIIKLHLSLSLEKIVKFILSN